MVMHPFERIYPPPSEWEWTEHGGWDKVTPRTQSLAWKVWSLTQVLARALVIIWVLIIAATIKKVIT